MNFWEMIAGRRGRKTTRSSGFGDEIRRLSKTTDRQMAAEREEKQRVEQLELNRRLEEQYAREDAENEAALAEFFASLQEQIRASAARGLESSKMIYCCPPHMKDGSLGRSVTNLPSYKKIKEFCERNKFALRHGWRMEAYGYPNTRGFGDTSPEYRHIPRIEIHFAEEEWEKDRKAKRGRR